MLEGVPFRGRECVCGEYAHTMLQTPPSLALLVPPSPRRGKANIGSTLEGRGHPVDAELAMSEPAGE